MALDRITKVNGRGVTEPLILGGDLEAQNGNFVGVITAGTFSGSFIGTVAGAASTAGYATTSFGLEGTPDIVVGSVTGTTASFSGNVSIAGTLTYEDVTNIDSVGLITARSGVIVQSGGLNVTGVSTFLGNVRLDDDDKILFGDNNYLQIYHDSATGTSHITNGEGNLIIGNGNGNTVNDVYIRSDDQVILGSIDGLETFGAFNDDGAVVLYYDNVSKFETTGVGATVIGDLSVSGDARVVGVLTIGSSSVTLDGNNNEVKVGTGITLSHTNGIYVGQVNLHSGGLDLSGGNIESHNINSTGIITAAAFVGDGSSLTGISAGYWEQTSSGINTISAVGIGTTIPATDTLLHLNKIGGTESLIRFTNSTTGTGVGDGAIVGVNVDENLVVAHFETKDILLSTDNTIRLKVKSDGKVGIGTDYDPSYKLDVEGDVNFTGNLYQNGTLFEAGGGSALTVTEVATPGGSVNVSVSDVSQIQFNNGSGFNVTDEGSGSVLIDLGSNFNPWYVDGQQTLKASGEEPIEIIAGPGIAITTKAVASVGIGTTFSKAITFSADGNSINGIGTAVPNTNTDFYYSGPLRINSYTLVDVPDNAESNVAYTRHTDIVVETGAELVIADGDEIITDVLDIASPSIIRPLGQAESTPSATLTVQNSGSVVGTGITTINFNTDLSVTVNGSTATVNSTASGGGGGGVSAALAIAYAIAL